MIKLQNIARTYQMGKTEVRALQGVDLEINEGECVAIMGPSGSGKSTLMHVIGALDRPDGGSIQFEGHDIADESSNGLAEIRGKKIGFVFQTFSLMPTLSALDNVELAMTFQGVPRSKRRARACQLLEQVGLGDRMKHRPSELSGGEQQRVAIARALANDPQILLADEPTGNLDSQSGQQIMELIESLNKEQGMTVILVTHDPNLEAYADRLIRLLDGKIDETEGGVDDAA
ncbi:MAG TPA: ABC transporter ATP-binding protein [Candidatus Heimdallarchaeota archaeon]|nr:ABC transporter ATP-binding protein [Candidatus Heimdallarchaeota archaeon]